VLTVDSTVLVRLVTNDEPKEAKRAAALFSGNKIYLPLTVLLETEWVLRYAYRLAPEVIAKSLRGVLGLTNVTVSNPLELNRALHLYEQGLDFAEALNVTTANGATTLKTLDSGLVKRARSAGISGVTLL